MDTFRIGLSPKLLDKATRFFNSSLDDILVELWQNARRANATKVEIFFDESASKLIVEDDGVGIFKDGVMLALGDSCWSNRTQQSEDPAGCGLFSLSGRGCIIESCGKKIALNQKQFSGRQDVLVETAENLDGTRIAFSVSSEEVETLSRIVNRRTLYYPLPVFFNGVEQKREDFLADAFYRETWNGLVLGVVNTSYYSHINFYGLVVLTNLPKIQVLPHQSLCLSVFVSVIDCPDLKLVLPARKEVVLDDFYQALVEQCQRTIFNYIQTLPSHRLDYKDWYKAANLGIELPEAEPILDTQILHLIRQSSKPC